MIQKVMIEFFSGSGNLADEFEKAGYRVLRIDNNPVNNPELFAIMKNYIIR